MNDRPFFEKIIYGGGVLFDLTKWAILFGIILALVNTFWISVFHVDGESMEPNLHNKELVLWQKTTDENDKLQRGQVVMVKYPGDPDHKQYVKRVVGLPGEKLEIKDSKLYINNKLLAEPYLPPYFITAPDGTWQMKANEYFVMGDNRENSNDSRFFGPAERRFVLGHALAVIFPRFLLVKDM